MKIVIIENTRHNHCDKCNAFWFEQITLSDFTEMKGAFEQDRLHCPKCNVLMVHMVKNDQYTIWYQVCKVCRGAFLDMRKIEV